MSVTLTVNGVAYAYPEVDDIDWGSEATGWASAVTTGMLQKAGGLFQLLADADFGTSFGIKSLYYKTRTANGADAGQIRLARADVISWRNQANGANLDLSVSATDKLQFNGADIQGVVAVTDTATIDLTFVADTLNADIKSDCITNAMINSAAAIAYSKLNLSGSIVNADVNASAAVALTKLAAMTASRAVVSDGSGFLVPATTTATEIGYVNGVTSAIQTQLNNKQATGNYITALTGDVVAAGPGSVAAAIQAGVITNAMVNAAAAIAYSKLNLTGSIVNADVNASAAIAYSKLNLALSIVNADVNASAAIAYSKLALTGSIVNADVSASAAIAFTKLASLTSAHILVGSGGGVATDVAVTGDISLTNAGVTAYAGTVPVLKGGTGQTSYTDGQLLIGNTTGNTLAKATLTAGAGISITNGSGTISIASSGSAPVLNYTAQSTTYAAVISDYISCSGASFTVTLPTAVSVAGKTIVISHQGTSLTQVYTLATTSAQTIGGIASGSYALYTNGETLTVVSNGANWIIQDHKVICDWVDAGACTIGGVTTPPTKPSGLVIDKIYWRRVGSNAEVRYAYKQNGVTGVNVGSGDYLFTLPTNLTVDTTNLSVYGGVSIGTNAAQPTNIVGSAYANISTSSGVGYATMFSTTQWRIAFVGPGDGGIAGSAIRTLNNTSTNFGSCLTVPIVGWQP